MSITTRGKWTLGTLFALMAGGGGVLTYQSLVTYDTLGELFVSQGYPQAVYRQVASSTWTSSPTNMAAKITAPPFTVAWQNQYAARYGHTVQSANGWGAGERYSDEALLEVMNAPGNPLRQKCNPFCVVADESMEEYDCKTMGKKVGGVYILAWDKIVEPAYAAIYPPSTPTPPTPTPTVPPPTPTSTPVPTPTPVPGPTGVLTQRSFPCPKGMERSTAQLCIEVWEAQ